AIFAPAHSVPHRLGHVEAAAEIDVDHLFPRLTAHPFHRAVARDAGIVDQNVDRAEVAFDLMDTGHAGVEVGHIPLVGLDAGALAELACFVLIAGIIGGNGDAFVAKRDADRLANAAGTTGDDSDVCHGYSPLWLYDGPYCRGTHPSSSRPISARSRAMPGSLSLRQGRQTKSEPPAARKVSRPRM